jgi:hypothetical protein
MREGFHALKTQAWADCPCWGQKPTNWIIKWKLFARSGTEKSISYPMLCFPDYWTTVLLFFEGRWMWLRRIFCWMYLNRMYVGRCAEGCFVGDELEEFSVAGVVRDQNMNSPCRLLYKLRGEISHDRRVDSTAAVVKFPVKTSADIVVINCYQSIYCYSVKISPSLPKSECTVGFPPLLLSSYSLYQTRGHQKLTAQCT